MTRKTTAAPEQRRAIVRRAETALRELHLSSWTEADKTRLFRVERAVRALDDEQADTKELLDAVMAAADRLLGARPSVRRADPAGRHAEDNLRTTLRDTREAMSKRAAAPENARR